MRLNTIDFHADAVNTAKRARAAVAQARAVYSGAVKDAKQQLDDGKITKMFYDELVMQAAVERDSAIQAAQETVRAEGRKFSAEMSEYGKLDGGQLDEGVLKILDSGLPLTLDDWKTLGKEFKDNNLMSRLLQDRYDKHPLFKEPNNGLVGSPKEKVVLRFGWNPQKRSERFEKFTELLAHTAATGTCLPEYKDQDSYWNSLAKTSCRDCGEIENDDFSTLDSEFPVETQTAQPQIW